MKRIPAVVLPGLIAFAACAASPARTPLSTDPPSPLFVQAGDTCAFEAWVIDEDPKGLNVRAGPSPEAAIVGTLPPMAWDPDLERKMGAGIKVLESRDGWFRIGDPAWSRNLGGIPDGPKGWIHGRYIDFAIQTDKAFAEPDPSSPAVATAWRDKHGGRQIGYRHPHECRGEWVRMLVKGHDGREKLGWLRGTCAIQETSCDGVAGDLMKYEDMPAH
ncbi:MAG TPA: SH3 domain-containing protein [Allosphingosinicella sp.]